MALTSPSSNPVAEIRHRKRLEKIERLQAEANVLVGLHPGTGLWLFGSLARGDWDAYSDVDVLAVAPSQGEADQLADAVLSAGLADDALALTEHEWARQRNSDDPYWRAIAQDALCLTEG